jgi:serine/threonine protein kinase
VFCVIYEGQPDDVIQCLILKIEQTIPCTKVIHITYNGIELNKGNSFAYYDILDGAIVNVKTNTEEMISKVACMGCSYHNVMYLSANVLRGLDSGATFSSETTKASIRQWLNQLDTNDQINIRRFLNFVTEHKLRFMVCTRDMFSEYVQKYRNTEYVNIVEFDYIQLLNELRCPICFSKFSLYSNLSNIPVQLCTLSDKHYVCQQCFQKVRCCPLCNGSLRNEAIQSKFCIDLLQTSIAKIEKYCFPTRWKNINIKNDQQPFAHGAFCYILRAENYAIKCPHVPAAVGSEVESAIIHEIFLARPLSHIPNILIVHGGIRLENKGISIVMEYVNGGSLATALTNGTILNLTFQERLDIALGICKGLGELHLAGIIHRDFKPENVLLKLSPTGHGYVPKIADFGVSFLIQTASATAVQKSAGTVGYDAPEVADGNTPSIQSDIYALSFTLYELLTAHRPFFGLKNTQIITKFTIKGERPTDWTVLPTDKSTIVLPELLKSTLEKGWSMAPKDRARIGEITCAVRKTINFDYRNCVEKISNFCPYVTADSSYDFMDKYDNFELLAIQEIIKRLMIDDSEAVELLLNNYAWG